MLPTLAKIGIPLAAGIAGGVVTFEIGPNLGTVLTALVNGIAAALISHALRKRATTALRLNDSRASRRKKARRNQAADQQTNP